MSFRKSITRAARAEGGAYKTVAARQQIVGQLADHLQKRNIQIRDISQLKEKHIRDWIAQSKTDGIADRTLQNRLTAVRGTLRAAGRHQLAARLDTKSFHIDNASREGARVAISASDYLERIARVADPGVRAVLELQHALGLRQQEGIMAKVDTLERWKFELGNCDKRIRIIAGTKGGREREPLIHDREGARAVIERAIAIAKENGGTLIDKPGLKEAMNRFNNVARAAGFIGENSPHALRYSFACAAIDAYLRAGLSMREALICTSHDLGHGDGRGRWVERVYSRRR